MIKIKVEGEKEENQQKLRKKRIKYNEEIEQLKVVVVDVGGGDSGIVTGREGALQVKEWCG